MLKIRGITAGISVTAIQKANAVGTNEDTDSYGFYNYANCVCQKYRN